MSLEIFFISEQGIQSKNLTLGENKDSALLSKLDFLHYIFPNSGVSNAESIEIKRLSKRHKSYVSLTTENDFKEFKRSLKVKNRARIIVFTGKGRRVTDDGLGGLNMLNTLLELFAKIFERPVRSEGCVSDDCDVICKQSDDTFWKQIHKNISCNACQHIGFESIRGYRYKCMICEDYDLCSNCFLSRLSSEKHERSHPMVVVESSDDLNKLGIDFVSNVCESVSKAQDVRTNIVPESPTDVVCEKSERLKVHEEGSDHRSFEERVIDKDSEKLGQGSSSTSLEISLKPVGRLLAQVMIENVGGYDFVISDGFRINVSFVDNTLSTEIDRNLVIKPGRVLKLNVGTNGSQIKYPIEVFAEQGSDVQMRAEFFSESDAPKVFRVVERSTSRSFDQHASTSPKCGPRPDQTLILPNLMENLSLNGKQYPVAAFELISDDDYDFVSVTDVDDLLSDFDIISRVSSSHE